MHRQAELAGQEQGARADERQVLARAAVDDPCFAGERSEAAPRRLVADGGQPRLAEGRHAAVEHVIADVEDADEVGDGRAERPARGPRDSERGLVAGGGRGRELGECLGREAGLGGGAQDRGVLATVSRSGELSQWDSA